MCLKIGKGRAATAWQRCHQLIRAKSQSTSKSGWSVGLLGWAKVREHSMLVAVTTELAFFSRVRFCFCASDSRTKLIIRQGAKKAVAQVCPEQHNMVPENCTVGLSKVARYACPSTDSGIATASARLQGSQIPTASPCGRHLASQAAQEPHSKRSGSIWCAFASLVSCTPCHVDVCGPVA